MRNSTRRVRVAIMEPKYQINLGYIARTLMNFGICELFLINPRCDYRGKQALRYAKHARDLLERAHICNSISDAAGGRAVIGTTGIWRKTGASFHNLYTLRGFGAMGKRISRGKGILLLIGRDDIGLTRGELRQCDATVFIAANKDYPIFNISHALAILLYEIVGASLEEDYSEQLAKAYADKGYQHRLTRLFRTFISSNPHIRDKESVALAFEHVLARAAPTKREINAIAGALAQDEEEVDNKTTSQKRRRKIGSRTRKRK